jgi:hypothetical protein
VADAPGVEVLEEELSEGHAGGLGGSAVVRVGETRDFPGNQTHGPPPQKGLGIGLNPLLHCRRVEL